MKFDCHSCIAALAAGGRDKLKLWLLHLKELFNLSLYYVKISPHQAATLSA
jgi:hypothetical protein